MHTPHLIAVELGRQRRRDIEREVREGRLSTGRARRRRRRLVRRLVLGGTGGRKLVRG